MTTTLNNSVYGAWAGREGEPVEVVAVKPNGRAVGLRVPGKKRIQYVPAKWIDGLEREPPRCPSCGQLLPNQEQEAP
jgi:hypothetical protein